MEDFQYEHGPEKDPRPDASILVVKNITKIFGSLKALDDLSFHVRQNEIFGIVGPNGAGKSTLLNVCTGALKATTGQIYFENKSILGFTPYRMCHMGIARTFQIPQVFDTLSILENIKTAAIFGSTDGRSVKAVDSTVDSILEMTELYERRDLQAGQADLLTRKMTMLAAVLATGPRLVFMDEPLAGFNMEEIQLFVDLILRVHGELAITFVIVEHNIKALARLSDRLMVVHFGHNICMDLPDVILKDPQVVDVYLGKEFDA